MNKSNRIEWLDIAKGIGIILVVLGHCVVKTDYIHKFIFSFHMPLFFILSGYCFHAEKYSNVKEVIIKKATALLIPYCKFMFLGLVVTLLIPDWRNELSVEGIITDLYLGYPTTVHITSIWYLISLYGITVVFYILYFLSEKYKKYMIMYMGVLMSGVAGYLIYIIKSFWGVGDNVAEATSKLSLPGGRLPLTIDASLMAMVFFSLGVLARKKNILYALKYRKTLLVLSGFSTIILSVFFNDRVNIHGCSYGNIVYFFICALGGTIAVVCLSQIISENLGDLVRRIRSILVYFGGNSLFMFAMQSLFVHLYVYLINKGMNEYYVLYENLPTKYGLVGFVAIMVVCLPLSHRVAKIVRKKWCEKI